VDKTAFAPGAAATIGTPDDLVDRIKSVLDVSGGFGTVIGFVHDWANPENTMRSWDMVARYVCRRSTAICPVCDSPASSWPRTASTSTARPRSGNGEDYGERGRSRRARGHRSRRSCPPRPATCPTWTKPAPVAKRDDGRRTAANQLGPRGPVARARGRLRARAARGHGGAGPAPDGAREQTKPRAWTWAALMHRAFGIDVLACPHCGSRLRLIATLHDPAVIRKILGAHRALSHSGRIPAPAHPSPAPPRPDRIRSGALRTPSCLRREVAFVCGVGRSAGRLTAAVCLALACCSPGPARSTREEAAHVRCGIGFWGGQCLSPGDYVRGLGATRGATAVGGG